MGYIKSHSKTWGELVGALLILISLAPPNPSWAAFASQFSLGIGEQYNDNIFFSKTKEHDFITSFLPTLSFFYAPPGETEPAGRLAITPTGEVYARHSALNNFGENVSINSSYLYRYSPRLTFNFSDTFGRQGPTRTGGAGELFALQTGPTTSVPGAGATRNLKDLVSGGDQLTNSLSLQGDYLFRPDISITSSYSNSYTRFIGAGGTDVFHTMGARGIYNWRRDHNLHAGYFLSISNSRNGDSELIHNFDFGDDYFSNYNLQLTPTLSLTASTGLAFTTGDNGSRSTDGKRKSGPQLASNTNITVTKLWETAALNAGFSKGLTPSFGISGISDTMAIFTNLIFRFTEKLSANADATWSHYDTEDGNFKTFQAGMGLQYTITSWLSAGLNYRFRWVDGGSGATQSDLLNRGTVNSNSVSLVLTSHFDLWPNTGLARSLESQTLNPILKTPFPLPSKNPSNIP